MIRFSLFALLILFTACSTAKRTTVSADAPGHMQFANLPEITVTPEEVGKSKAGKETPPYKASAERTWDLLHTRLRLTLDIPGQKVMGQADLTLTPLFYVQNEVRIDAVGMTFTEIRTADQVVSSYTYDGRILRIPLAASMRRDETLQVSITYSVIPVATAEEPAAAVTSDRGLFFIDPLDTLPYVPPQVWSQGETSFNSKWFPTLDQPNERQTQEVILTVPDTLMTLSNGLLTNSIPNADGTRTDTWALDLPHAPYLTMIAVGRWDKVTDYWRGRPVEYYVDEGFGPSARAIFAHTPEMLDFFSRRLGYAYVWPKYAQVVVKDFVSGAMENTTAVTFGDFVQFHADDVIEFGANDYIVAHEMFHHWFGDLVTCESWAHLVLNEGFANYAEYLWSEYKYGRERADLSRLSELSGYFDQVGDVAHPLIHFHYDKADDMFDAHSYNKGGLVLHMLRDVVGDEAFFAAVQRYLRDHAFQAAEIHDLRQAFEAVTGQDLNWFFDQWFFGVGHPVLNVDHTYDESTGKLEITIRQTQAEKGYTPLFRLPMEIGIVDRDSVLAIHRVVLDQREQVLSFPLTAAPLAVIPDPRDILLSEYHDRPDADEVVVRLLLAPSVNHRISAWRSLGEGLTDELLDRVMADSSRTIRRLVAAELSGRSDVVRLGRMADAEQDPLIQNDLLEFLLSLDAGRAQPLANRILAGPSRPALIAAALHSKAKVDPAEALTAVRGLAGDSSSAIQAARVLILSANNQADEALFRSPAIAAISDEYLQDIIHAYAKFLSSMPAARQDEGLSVMTSDHFRRTPALHLRRFYTIAGLVEQYNEESAGAYSDKLAAAIRMLYDQEKDPYLRDILKEGLGRLVD